MTDAKPIRAKGATNYGIVEMGDEEFESMNARLVRLEFPEAFKPANVSDGGADMVLPKADGKGYQRCWQSKHFSRNPRWEKCKTSLANAQKNWKPEHYTFIFPRELTVGEQKTFDKHFRGPDVDIKVDHWNGEELQARLNGSDEGQRVARTFFDDVELDRENTYRAIEAAGRLDTTEDALDRFSNIGGYLDGKDAFFSYPAATHEAAGPAPPVTPGSIMSFAKSDGKVSSRVDVVPRDADAMERYGPEFVLQPTDGEKGERAAERLQEALREGKAVEIGEGLDLTFTQMPPGFDDVVGRRMTGGSVQLGPAELIRRAAQPWHARLRATSDQGDASLDVHLEQAEAVPDGWDDAFSGQYGSLTVNALVRRHGSGGELRWNFRSSRNNASVREQLGALNFLKALSGTGEIVVTDRGRSTRPKLRLATPAEPLPPEMQALNAFLADVRAIEEWAGVEYELPEDISAQEARNVAMVASIVRNRGRSVVWSDFEMTVGKQGLGPLRDGRLLRIELKAAANLLGRIVDLGQSRFDIADYVVVSEAPAPGQPGHVLVSIKPGSKEGAELFERLVKDATPARRLPPAPRDGKRNRGGKGRRKRRR